MTWSNETLQQVAAVRDLIAASTVLGGQTPTPALIASVRLGYAHAADLLDPLLLATNQGTCAEALESGDAGKVAAAAGRALAQVLQLDFGGVRPDEARPT